MLEKKAGRFGALDKHCAAAVNALAMFARGNALDGSVANSQRCHSIGLPATLLADRISSTGRR
jgi:hypothetical protein